jgi:hypothetical protein
MSAKTSRKARQAAKQYGFVFQQTFTRLIPQWIRKLANRQAWWLAPARYFARQYIARWQRKHDAQRVAYESRSMNKLERIARGKIAKGLPL